jgi:hypothetical protein
MIVPMLLDIDEFNNRLPQNLATFWAFPEISIGHCFSFPCDEQFARCIIRALLLLGMSGRKPPQWAGAGMWHGNSVQTLAPAVARRGLFAGERVVTERWRDSARRQSNQGWPNRHRQTQPEAAVSVLAAQQRSEVAWLW